MSDHLDREQRVDQIIADYLDAQMKGEAPDPEALLAQHPDLSDTLRSFFETNQVMRGLAGKAGTKAAEQLSQNAETLPIVAIEPEQVTVPPSSAMDAPTVAPSVEHEDTAAFSFNQPNTSTSGLSCADKQIPGYEILGELGRGGMGVVYKARHLKLNRVVALKMILAAGHSSSANLARFMSEAEAVANFSHPNIVQVHDVGHHNNLPYMALEFVTGGTLGGKLKHGPMRAIEAAKLVEQIARGMNAAHQGGIVHRDLKPDNVLLTEDGNPKVTDFGLAKKVEGGSGLTQTGAIMGTPSYMAPEQASGEGKRVGPAADVYSLGAILYCCLTGRPPFQASTPLDTILQVVSEEPKPPRQWDPKIPKDLETICLKCLQKDAPKRYVSAEALAEDLRRWREGEPITARPVGRFERAVKWMKRRPTVAMLTAASTVATVLLIGFWFHFTSQLSEQLDRANWLLYGSQISLAQRAFQDGDIIPAKEFLRNCQVKQRGWEFFYLDHLFHHLGQQTTKQGRSGKDRDETTSSWVSFDPTGEPLTATGYVIAAFSNDGKKIADAGTLNRSKVITIREARTGIERQKLTAPSVVHSLCFSPDGTHLASGSKNEIQVWDLQTNSVVLTLDNATSMNCVCFSPDGKRIAATSDSSLKVWDAKTGKNLLWFSDRTDTRLDWYTAIQYSHDGKRLATGNHDKSVRIWDANSGEQLFVLSGHTGTVWSVGFSPDGKRVASGGSDGTVKIWNIDPRTPTPDRGQVIHNLVGHTSGIQSLRFHPDGTRLASGCADGTVKVWDAIHGQRPLELKVSSQPKVRLSFRPDSTQLAVTDNRQVKIWDMKKDEITTTLTDRLENEPRVHSVDYSRDGHLATGHDDSIRIWNAAGEKLRTIKTKSAIHSVSLSPDGKRVAAGSGMGSADAVARIWDATTGQELTQLPHEYAVINAKFSPDGKRLATLSGSSLKVWSSSTWQVLFSIDRNGATEVCFSPDGARIAIAGGGSEVERYMGTAEVWGTEAGRLLCTLKGHQGIITSLCFSPDGNRIATASQDSTVKVWESSQGHHVLTLKKRDGFSSVCFSPDGTYLAAANEKGLVSAWQASRHDSPTVAYPTLNEPLTLWQWLLATRLWVVLIEGLAALVVTAAVWVFRKRRPKVFLLFPIMFSAWLTMAHGVVSFVDRSPREIPELNLQIGLVVGIPVGVVVAGLAWLWWHFAGRGRHNGDIF